MCACVNLRNDTLRESVWDWACYLQLLLLVLQRAFELRDAPVFFLHHTVSLCLALLQSGFFSLKLRAGFLKGTAQVLRHRDEG